MSTGYYRTREGRRKKQALNSRRSLSPALTAAPDGAAASDDAVLASYLESTLSMVEGRPVGPEEIRAHLERWREELRQYSLVAGDQIRKLPDQ